jgi:hypothetical protein
MQLGAFAALTDLQSLSLTAPGWGPFSTGAGQLSALLSDSFIAQLGQLTKLTSLQLSAKGQALWSGPGSQHICCLTALQRLSLAAGEGYWRNLYMLFPESANGLQRLTALTSLELVGFKGSTIPSMGALSALQRVVLHDCCHFDPSSLLGLTAIAHLEVLNCEQAQPDTSKQTNRALLPVLQQQQQLTLLQLDSFLHEEDASYYAALTASSMLRTLQLPGLNTVPVGAWHYVFQPGRRLQHLTCLQLAGQNQLGSLSAAEMLLLVQACPALQELSLRSGHFSHDRWADLQLGLLADLAHLTKLSVTGTDDEQLPQVVQLSQLRDVSLIGSYFSFESVAELTAVHQLTRLHLSLCSFRQGPSQFWEFQPMLCPSPVSDLSRNGACFQFKSVHVIQQCFLQILSSCSVLPLPNSTEIGTVFIHI